MKAIRGNIFHRHLLLFGHAIGYRWKYFKKERSRHIRIWTSSAGVQLQFLESVCPQWGYNRINSFSNEKRMVSRSGFGICCGRIGLIRIHSGQAPIGIWNSGFRDCQRNLEDYSGRFPEKEQCLGGDSIQRETSNACGQASDVSSLFFNINETEGHTMILSDLLAVELYNDSLKMFNQAWDETLPAFWQWFGQTCPGDLYERRLKKVYTDEAYDDTYQQDVVLKISREDAKDWGPWSMTSSSSNSRTCWFVKKRAIKRRQHILPKGLKKKAGDCRFWDVKNVCAPKEENLHSNITRQRKEKAKGIGQDAQSTVTIQENDKYARKPGNSPSGKRVVLRVLSAK